jgi:hypothetical protein
MRFALIVVMCVVAAMMYGILHDQITARVCVEYFTVAHPPVFQTDDPTLLGIGWGIIATWWVGLILGLGLIVGARMGRREPRSVRSLVKPILQLLAVMAAFAFAAGIAGYFAGWEKWIVLEGPYARDIPAEKHAAFFACGFAHTTSYFVGLAGGLIVIVRIWLARKQGERLP